MACSKIFSGDLPELLNEIIQYFHHDYKTLYSCILVNRLWCRLAIPLLWEDPFSIPTKSCHLIKTYLHNLNDDYKTKLNEYGINNNSFLSNTLFNYPIFIRCLSTFKIKFSIESWVTTVRTSTTNEQPSNYSTQNTNLSHSDPNIDQIIIKLIYKSLFLIFIENEVNLHTLEVSMNTYEECDYFDDVFELILQNPNFICNIRNLILDVDIEIENISKFLSFIYSSCNSILSIDFLFPSGNNPTAEKYLSQIINSQKILKDFTWFNDFPLYHSLLSLKNLNCSNTLNTIIFYHVNFKNIVVLNEAFEQLNVLGSVHILYCYTLDYLTQQITNITKPFKLKSLFLDGTLQIESLKPLIQKSANYLENFGIESHNELHQSLESIIKYCSKIKVLKLGLNNQIIHSALNFIDNIRQNLNYLIFGLSYNVELSSNILLNLGKILPFKLEYLCLQLKINTNSFEIFLKDSQNTFIKKLLIRNIKTEENGDIVPYIKEYIMEKRRVKYLAILETFQGKSEDLSSMKDKVKEFKSYDIQILNYYNSLVHVYEFIKETD